MNELDPIKTAYIAGYMTHATWEDDADRASHERHAEKVYEYDLQDNWYNLADAEAKFYDKQDEASFVIKAARGTRMDEAGIRQLDLLWKEYHALKEELASERSKRKQIEELYDLLVANIAPLIDAAREFEHAKNDDSKTIHKIRRIVRYL